MKILEFAKDIGKLKRTKRIGWVNYNVPSSESVAEHSFRVAMLAMVLAPSFKVNQNKAVKMALVHDVGEAVVGDIVKQFGKKKHPDIKNIKKREEDAFIKIFSTIDGKEYIKLYKEYETMRTKEARFVKQIDRLEFMIQAQEYEKEHRVTFPVEFYEWSSIIMKDKRLKKLLEEIESLRKK